MVNTRTNPAPQEQAEGSEVRDANLPHPPSLAEVMMEAERNKRETNRLLVQDLILAPMVHKLREIVCFRMNMLSFQAMEVTSMRTTTDRSELVIVSLVRTSCVVYRPAWLVGYDLVCTPSEGVEK